MTAPDGNGDKFLLGRLSEGFNSLGDKCDAILSTFKDHTASDEREFVDLHKAIRGIREEQTSIKVSIAKWAGGSAAVVVIVSWIVKITIAHIG